MTVGQKKFTTINKIHFIFDNSLVRCFTCFSVHLFTFLPMLSGKLINWSVFYPKPLTLLPSNSSAKCFITKWKSKFDLLCISVGIALGIVYFKLQMLWAVSLCFPVKCNDLLLFENFYLQSYVYNKLFDTCIILQSFS